jgi:uncharacterized membrane protein YhdT
MKLKNLIITLIGLIIISFEIWNKLLRRRLPRTFDDFGLLGILNILFIVLIIIIISMIIYNIGIISNKKRENTIY